MKSFFAAANRFLVASHLRWMLLVTLCCLGIKEQYPFSNFPMYSAFSRSTSYVFLADGNDQPLATFEAAAMSTPKLKKVFSNELVRARRAKHLPLTAEEKRGVGKKFLQKLQTVAAKGATPANSPEVWRLYEVHVLLAAGRLEKKTELVAQLP